MKIRKTVFLLLFVLLFSYLFAEKTSVEGLYRYKLDNGLELFVVENDSAPLAYIEIAVRAGAVTQTPENAGLFHLYEHMMFKGNEKYPDQNAFTDAANNMGRIDENGSTGVDRVNYFFTLPAKLVRDGLEFWSYAIRTPLMNLQELENEKAVVLSEINADFTAPGHIAAASLYKTMFPQAPWRLDPAGSPSVVKRATVESLLEIQGKYYIPANSAIFVGGDVDSKEVYKYVREIFSDWKNPSQIVKLDPLTKEPLSKDKKLVFVNKGSSDEMIQASYYLRGPDGETDSEDTYAADAWLNIINFPGGAFPDLFISEKGLGIPESDYVGFSYPTRRACSLIGFHAAMLNSSYFSNEVFLSPVEKSEKFLTILKTKALSLMLDKNEFFKDRGIDKVIQKLEDDRIYEMESARAVLASLSFFWAACGSDYFFTYDKNISKVTEDDIIDFVKKYVENKKGTLLVTVSPGIWEKYKKEFISLGYEKINEEDAFWHYDYDK